MAKTLSRISKYIAVLLAAVVLVTCACLFVGCESNYPKITVTISFNDNNTDTEDEYVLTYKLYRKLYPQTVAHYLELAEAGYYDGTVIHDYQSSRMIGGGYTYEDMTASDVDELQALDYDGATKDADGNITLKNISVWTDKALTEATNRLYGETSNNGFSVENGTGLTNSYGALSTYSYIAKENSALSVFGKATGGGTAREVRYTNNSVTSLFSIYTGASGSSDSANCVFGVLADTDSSMRFSELMTAITDYVAAQQETDEDFSFTQAKEDVRIEDEFAEGGYYEVDSGFAVPVVKIVIEQIKVIKY